MSITREVDKYIVVELHNKLLYLSENCSWLHTRVIKVWTERVVVTSGKTAVELALESS